MKYLLIPHTLKGYLYSFHQIREDSKKETKANFSLYLRFSRNVKNLWALSGDLAEDKEEPYNKKKSIKLLEACPRAISQVLGDVLRKDKMRLNHGRIKPKDVHFISHPADGKYWWEYVKFSSIFPHSHI